MEFIKCLKILTTMRYLFETEVFKGLNEIEGIDQSPINLFSIFVNLPSIFINLHQS